MADKMKLDFYGLFDRWCSITCLSEMAPALKTPGEEPLFIFFIKWKNDQKCLSEMFLMMDDFGIIYKASQWPVLYDKCIGEAMVVRCEASCLALNSPNPPPSPSQQASSYTERNFKGGFRWHDFCCETNLGESGLMAWKNRVLDIFHPIPSHKIRSAALLISTLILRRCKMTKFYLHVTFVIFRCHCDSDCTMKEL